LNQERLAAVSQSVSQPASQPVSQSVSQPASQSVSQPVSQSVGQSLSQAVSQPVSQSVSHSLTHYEYKQESTKIRGHQYQLNQERLICKENYIEDEQHFLMYCQWYTNLRPQKRTTFSYQQNRCSFCHFK